MTGIIAISRNTSSIIAVFCRTRTVAPLPKAQRRSILKRIEEIAENLGRDLPRFSACHRKHPEDQDRNGGL